MKSNKELLKIAQSHLDEGGARFRKFVGLPSWEAWCNAFVDYIADEGGVSKLYFNGKKETYCPHSIKWCRANLAQVPLFLAMPMDIIYFDWDKNGNPNHIGFVRGRNTTSSILTIEGNTDKKDKNGKTIAHGVVAERKRNGKYVQAVYRPHFVPSKVGKKKLNNNAEFAYYSVYNLQLALGMKPTGILTKETVKYLQRKAGATADGAWGNGTSKAVQKMLKNAGYYKGEIDGAFGASSVKALKMWINGKNYPTKKTPAKKTETKTTNAQKIVAKAKELAWAYGTHKEKYDYKTGNPKKVCKSAMKKYGWADNRAELSDCGNFASTVVRESGVSKTFKALHGVKTPFPKKETGFSIVLDGKKIPKGFLKAGDIVRYKKKNGKQHALIYMGNGKICEASHHNRFGCTLKDNGKYNEVSKPKTIQVLRAKE